MLALIAGEGALPAAIAAARPDTPLVAALEGFRPENLRRDADLIWRVETMGTLLARLKARGVTEVCLCGAVDRPVVDMGAIDDATLPLIPVLRDALQGLGDDGVLRAVMGIFEAAGFKVRAGHEVAPALLPPPGVLTRAQPPVDAEEDARQGDVISVDQGGRDLGQACVIRDGRVVAREDSRGTNAMLSDLQSGMDGGDFISSAMDGVGDLIGAASDWLGGELGGGATRGHGMFYKAPKPGQDTRADLPVIGPQTVRAVRDAGLAGITIAAGGVMVLDRDAVIAACDAAGLYLWVRTS